MVGAHRRTPLKKYNIPGQKFKIFYLRIFSIFQTRRNFSYRGASGTSMKFISMLSASLAFGFSGFCIVPLYCARFHDFVHTLLAARSDSRYRFLEK